MKLRAQGQDSTADPETHSGVMILVSRKAFRNIVAQEHVRGRLLQVRATHIKSQLPIDIYGVYQHVYRTHLTPTRIVPSVDRCGMPCKNRSTYCQPDTVSSLREI